MPTLVIAAAPVVHVTDPASADSRPLTTQGSALTLVPYVSVPLPAVAVAGRGVIVIAAVVETVVKSGLPAPQVTVSVYAPTPTGTAPLPSYVSTGVSPSEHVPLPG